MFKSYLKIVLRNLRRHKGYAFINIAGLAMGLACCVLILLWVQDELSFDAYHQNAERIYRLVEVRQEGDRRSEYPSSPFGVTPALKTEFGENVTPVRFFRYSTIVPLISHEDKRFHEKRFFFADSTVFNVFSFVFISGNPQTALRQPHSVVLTRDMARKYFGDENSLGKVLRFENQIDFQVTGVIENVPANSHFHFDFLASLLDMETVFRVVGTPVGWLQSMYWNPCRTYVLLPENFTPTEFESRMPALVEKYYPDSFKHTVSFYTQNLLDIHLRGGLEEEIEPQGDITYVYIFAIMALFILALACVNFMNLSTARASMRAKEVGLRKVLGAFRLQLARQFLGEALLFSLLALLLALVLIEMALPLFNSITEKELSIDYLDNWHFLFILLGLTLLVGFFSGSYPAFFLSRFQPAPVLKGDPVSAVGGHAALRKALVVFQFSISIMLIAGTLVVSKQLDFLRNTKLGFSKEHRLVLSLRGTPLRQQPNAFKTELLKLAGVSGVTVASDYPGSVINIYPFFVKNGDEVQRFDFPAFFSDHDFISVMGMELREGRHISPQLASDSTEAFILNETAVKALGWESAIGKEIRFSSNPTGRVVGVVKDFNFISLHQLVQPAVIHVKPSWYEYMLVKVEAQNLSATIADIRQVWAQFTNNRPYDYLFLDDALEQFYRSEQKLSQVFRSFTVLAIFIACLGLFGLAAFAAEQRTKEVGIRKVLGATVASVVNLLSRDFVKLVLIANLIAAPLAYFAMNKWLENFA
jgi:putative ABC transport system permease protein